MKTHNLGYPRIGDKRQLKKACESYWDGKISAEELLQVGKTLRINNWELQKNIGIDLVPSNDFSLYDHVLDMALTVGAIPNRFKELAKTEPNLSFLDLYFAMARGYQSKTMDIKAMEMTKWFDTNYHYMVPEFYQEQTFQLISKKPVDEFKEAKQAGIITKPVLIGPVSFLLLGKTKETSFNPLDLLKKLMPVYLELIGELLGSGAKWIQFDEPFLAMDLTAAQQEAFIDAYAEIKTVYPNMNSLLATYFEGLRENTRLALSLPISAIHLDLVRDSSQLDHILKQCPKHMHLSLGVINGRNVWKSNLTAQLSMITHVQQHIGSERLFLAPSCSLLHVPCDVELETNEQALPFEIKNRLAFAKQKLQELTTLKELCLKENMEINQLKLLENQDAIDLRETSKNIHDLRVKARVYSIHKETFSRKSSFEERRKVQRKNLKLPLFPTTTIGSFPQTPELRATRAKFRKGEISLARYEKELEKQIVQAIRLQEEIGLDVLVHGEFERTDMVEYFGEQLNGFVFTQHGWVQSYGSRCVKPPIIYGDVSRKHDLTVRWSTFAQQQTRKLMKGMLTGPVTMLQWSFARDDQPREDTCMQIAFALRDEVHALEKHGIKIIQIDEPALREGLPLRKIDWGNYLGWAVKAFKISTSGVKDETQIHTHMCYSEFNDIIGSIAGLDADVITIETSRSEMELLEAFVHFKYPNEIGPGVYDIHSPRIPTVQEMEDLLQKAMNVLPVENIWVNPDCGLKTRKWPETIVALKHLVEAAKQMRLNLVLAD